MKKMITFNKETSYDLIEIVKSKKSVIIQVLPTISNTVGLDKDYKNDSRYIITKENPLIIDDIDKLLSITKNNTFTNEEIVLWEELIELAFRLKSKISYYNQSDLATIVNIKF
jgi:hypothetical protein